MLRPNGIGFFVPNDVGSAMTLDLIWEPQIHRPLWQALDCHWKEKRLGLSKVTDRVEGWIAGEADSEKEICVQSFPGEYSQGHNLGKWKQRQQRQKSSCHAAVPMEADAAFQSWLKLWQRGQSLTSHIDQSLGAGCRQEKGTVEGQLSFFHQVQLPVRDEPRHQPPMVPQLGKEWRVWCGRSSPAWLAAKCAT